MKTRAVLVFVDGLGVGEKDPRRNPMACYQGGLLNVFRGDERRGLAPFGGIPCPLDAALGVPGVPQSATGQTALLTGVNAPRELGMHLFGFPNARLRAVIREHSLLKAIRARGLRPAFLNAYRPAFFELGDAVWEKPLSVTTWTNKAADLPFFTLADVAAGRAIYQEFTNRTLRERGFDVPEYSPEEAGQILARRSRDFDFLLFEYFRTDGAGHGQEMQQALHEITSLERFLNAALAAIDLDETLVILSSDHGNIEDLAIRGHTSNPALTLVWGKDAWTAASRLASILDVPRVILEALAASV